MKGNIYPERQRVWDVRGASLNLRRRHPSAAKQVREATITASDTVINLDTPPRET